MKIKVDNASAEGNALRTTGINMTNVVLTRVFSTAYKYRSKTHRH